LFYYVVIFSRKTPHENYALNFSILFYKLLKVHCIISTCLPMHLTIWKAMRNTFSELLNEFVKVRQRLNVIFLHKKLKILQFFIVKTPLLVETSFYLRSFVLGRALSTTKFVLLVIFSRKTPHENYILNFSILFYKLLKVHYIISTCLPMHPTRLR
jgi:hypothetical protein